MMVVRVSKWDHKNDNFYEAIGVTKEEIMEAYKKFRGLMENDPMRGQRSRTIQVLVENFDPVMAILLYDAHQAIQKDIRTLFGGDRT